MIKDNELKESIDNYLISRGLRYANKTKKQLVWLLNKNTYTSKSIISELEKTRLFFELRGYQFIRDCSSNYLRQFNTGSKVELRPKIAGIQDYKDNNIEGNFAELIYCTRFNDCEDTSRHYPGFFMLGLHSFKVDKIPSLLFHLETVVDFFRSKGITNIYWDSWTDGHYKGNCIEFFKDDIEIANLVFIKRDDRIIIDLGIGWERYCNLVGLSLPTREVLLTLTNILFYLNNLKPGRRGIEDNIKRVVRITRSEDLSENVDKAIEYWLDHTLEDLRPKKKEIIEYLQQILR